MYFRCMTIAALSRHGTAHLSLLRVVSGQFTFGKLGRGSGHSRKHWQPASSRQFRPLSFSTLKPGRSEEHTSELQSLMRISYAVFCLKKKKKQHLQRNKHKETK